MELKPALLYSYVYTLAQDIIIGKTALFRRATIMSNVTALK